MLGAWKLYPTAVPVLPTRQHHSVSEFLTLYRNGLPFVRWHDLKVTETVGRIILTDTQIRQSIKNVPRDVPTLIIEHHPQERDMRPHETWAGEDIGAATTLVVEQIQAKKIRLSSLEATLMALGIYADTGMMTYGGTTPRDMRAAAWLMEQGAVLDTVQRFLSNPLNTRQQTLFDTLFDQAESRTIQGYEITLCSATIDEQLGGINSVTASLRDIWDADALFVLVKMPKNVQLVCRSKEDAIHVGELANHFGGGGHPRAAAATIYKGELDDVTREIWQYLQQHIRPAVRVGDLMSYGVQTVTADERIAEIIPRLRRIGHEGYPVLDDEAQVVGLLTLRDADRTLEHGLKTATVRDVMLGGNVTLTPDDPVALLEETMVTSDWGQIPVINHSNKLLGIVTRTDLIKHWVKVHPSKTPVEPHIELEDASDILGAPNVQLIQLLASAAQNHGVSMYMVGGVVRDLVLERPNYDIDFVIEGDGIAFAEHLQATYGGKVHSHKPFGTAKWHINEDVADALGLSLADVPDHVDFATARSELYEHPTALPTVYNSGIKLDLRRRDFTINTLAVQLSPAGNAWQLLDSYGGLADLETRLVRVLHSLSFVDDPTRILRAVRFSERLQFTIEPRTTELIQSALPMLSRITGERLRNELSLLLKEDDPTRGFLKLEVLGALRAIEPHFHVTPTLKEGFQALQAPLPDWIVDDVSLRWHLVLAQVDHAHVIDVSRRLLFSQRDSEAMHRSAQIIQQAQTLTGSNAELVNQLHAHGDTALAAIWLLRRDQRARIAHYRDTLRHIKPIIDGNDLKARGLPPGPEYRVILARLREAWLNGDVNNPDDEQQLLEEVIDEVYGDSTGQRTQTFGDD